MNPSAGAKRIAHKFRKPEALPRTMEEMVDLEVKPLVEALESMVEWFNGGTMEARGTMWDRLEVMRAALKAWKGE